jgi:hypothetical protein
MGGVINSAGRVRYQYTCEQSPIRDYCNAQACQTVKYGVGHKPWNEEGSFEDITVSKLRRINSNPPVYILDVNGADIELMWEDFFSYQRFRNAVGQRLNIVAPLQKQGQWEMKIKDLLDNRENIEAPEDASEEGLIMNKFHEFMSLRERAINREDLLRGIPITDGAYVLFRVGDFKHWLQGYKLDRLEGGELFNLLRRDGCVHRVMEMNGRKVTVWAYPLSKVNEVKKDFEIPEFSKEFGDEI